MYKNQRPKVTTFDWSQRPEKQAVKRINRLNEIDCQNIFVTDPIGLCRLY